MKRLVRLCRVGAPAIAISAALLLAPAAARALFIAELDGGTVTFLNITDTNGSFISASAGGDTLDFNANLTADVTGTADVSDAVTFDVVRKEEFVIDLVLIDAGGLFTFLGAGAGGTIVVNALVDVIEAWDGTSLIDVQALDPGNEFYFTSSFGGPVGAWSADPLAFSIGDILGSQIPALAGASATQLQVTISASLSVSGSAPSSLSLNNAEGMVFTVIGSGSAIPEPSTALILGVGLAGIGLWRRHAKTL